MFRGFFILCLFLFAQQSYGSHAERDMSNFNSNQNRAFASEFRVVDANLTASADDKAGFSSDFSSNMPSSRSDLAYSDVADYHLSQFATLRDDFWKEAAGKSSKEKEVKPYRVIPFPTMTLNPITSIKPALNRQDDYMADYHLSQVRGRGFSYRGSGKIDWSAGWKRIHSWFS